jgi:hypothetical protein
MIKLCMAREQLLATLRDNWIQTEENLRKEHQERCHHLAQVHIVISSLVMS